MIVKLLTEHNLDFLAYKEAAQARLSLHLSKYQIVGNHMHWLINVSSKPPVVLVMGSSQHTVSYITTLIT